MKSDEMFPADLILVASSAEGGNSFIETASLDGEKNLKPRSAFSKLNKFGSRDVISQLKGEFSSNIPDKDLHRFSAKIKI